MNDHAADVWKNRALEAEQKLFRAYEDLAKSRGNELVLHAELADYTYIAERHETERMKAEAAIARVRELCSDTHCHSVDGLMYPGDVMHVLDGGTE